MVTFQEPKHTGESDGDITPVVGDDVVLDTTIKRPEQHRIRHWIKGPDGFAKKRHLGVETHEDGGDVFNAIDQRTRAKNDKRLTTEQQRLDRGTIDWKDIAIIHRKRATILQKHLNVAQETICTLNEELVDERLRCSSLIEGLKAAGADPEFRNRLLEELGKLEQTIVVLMKSLLSVSKNVALSKPRYRNDHNRRLFKSNRRRAQMLLTRHERLDDMAPEKIKEMELMAGALEPLEWYKPSYTYQEFMEAIVEASRLQMKHHQEILLALDPLREASPEIEKIYRVIYDHAIREGMRPMKGGTQSYKLSLKHLKSGVYLTLPAPSTASPFALINTANKKYEVSSGPWFPPLADLKQVDMRIRPKYLDYEELKAAEKDMSEYLSSKGGDNRGKPILRDLDMLKRARPKKKA